MEYTKHMMKRMNQRGFDQEMIDIILSIGSHDLTTNKLILDRNDVILLREELTLLKEKKDLIQRALFEIN